MRHRERRGLPLLFTNLAGHALAQHIERRRVAGRGQPQQLVVLLDGGQMPVDGGQLPARVGQVGHVGGQGFQGGGPGHERPGGAVRLVAAQVGRVGPAGIVRAFEAAQQVAPDVGGDAAGQLGGQGQHRARGGGGRQVAVLFLVVW